MPPLILFLLVATSSLLPLASSQCSSLSFSGGTTYALCASLPHLGASLHWTLDPLSGSVDVAFSCPSVSPGWVAWGINPTADRMVGTQALVAVLDGTGAPRVYTSSIDSYEPVVRPGQLSFNVTGLSGAVTNGAVTIFATVRLPGNGTRVRHVWQSSGSLAGGFPSDHVTAGDNGRSFGSFDFLSGEAAGGGSDVTRRRHVHGILNGISWGVLMPIGAVIARYLRVFESADPAWFYLHIACQISAYVIGVAGWGTGLKLGSDSSGIVHERHRAIGIALFSLATLQIFALFLRPNKDHKKRKYWNIYHHSVGYLIIVLSIVNIFKGFTILGGARDWRNAYIAIISTVAGAAVVLEAFTWYVVIRRRRDDEDRKRINGTA